MSHFSLKFISIEDSIYPEAVSIRKELFFKNMKNSDDLINDSFEKDSIQLVYLIRNKPVGVGRLHFENSKGVISQMAIKESHQRKGVGKKILIKLIECSKKNKVETIELAARETAINFYKKFNFQSFGKTYPSKKTGIIHQKMILNV